MTSSDIQWQAGVVISPPDYASNKPKIFPGVWVRFYDNNQHWKCERTVMAEEMMVGVSAVPSRPADFAVGEHVQVRYEFQSARGGWFQVRRRGGTNG